MILDESALHYFRSTNPISRAILYDIDRVTKQRLQWDKDELKTVINENLIDNNRNGSYRPAETEIENNLRKFQNDLWQPLLTVTAVPGQSSHRNTMTEIYDGHSGPFSWRSKSQEDIRLFGSDSNSYLIEPGGPHDYESRMVLRPNPFIVSGDNKLDLACPSSHDSKESINIACGDFIGESNIPVGQNDLIQGLKSFDINSLKQSGRYAEVADKKQSQVNRHLEHVNEAFLDSLENLQKSPGVDNKQKRYDTSVSSEGTELSSSMVNTSHHASNDTKFIRETITCQDGEEKLDFMEEDSQRLLCLQKSSEIPHSGFDFLDNW